MDFIKGNDLVRIDPSGIDISGAGHIVIDSNSITGDISITGDVSMNGKVSISDNFDVTGDIKLTNNGAIKFDDTQFMIKTVNDSENDYLHITAPLCIHADPGVPPELDRLGWNGDRNLTYDADYITNTPVGDAGGWYLVRQTKNATGIEDLDDNFHFGISAGEKDDNDAGAFQVGHHYSRNVSIYDYDEVLFYNHDNSIWQIWDRSALETLLSRYNGAYLENISGIKKSSRSEVPHNIYGHVRIADTPDPQLFYVVKNTADALENPGLASQRWLEWHGHAFSDSFYVRRSDGQPVRLKNKVKVDVSGNLNVGGTINCSRISGGGVLVVEGDDIIGNPWPPHESLIIDSKPVLKLQRKSELMNGDGTNIFNNSAFSINLERYSNAGTTYPYTKAHFNLTTNGSSTSYTDNTVITLVDTGKVGIGTTSPSYALDVNGDIGASGSIHAPNYMNPSDRRIKTEITNVDDDRALQQVNALESKEYHYISKRQKIKTVGFIAQEVKEVIPNAVLLCKDFIPDEMRTIAEPQWEGNVLTIPDLDMSGAFTGKAKFYVSNEPSGNDEVCKEVLIKEVHMNESTPLFPKTKFVAEFEKQWDNVFFYGKEVTDFHTIDKNKIFALHHSAIQELSRRNTFLREEVSIKTNKITSIEVRLEALETALLAMQTLVEALH